jgi:aminoglycoside 3-N-acetyltransferase
MSKPFTVDMLKELLHKVIQPGDEAILIYSGIWTFGHRLKVPPQEIPGLVLDAIDDCAGKDRTVVFPAYTYAYNKERRFDIRNTKPETGVLPEAFMRREGVKRTRSAISGFLAKGPLADEMVPILGRSVWGENSLLEWMETRNIRIVTLGLPWALSCGYLHRIEELARVPYRYYKEFPGAYRDENGTWKKWTETMYVRPMGVRSLFNWHLVNELLYERRQVLFGSLPGVQIESCLAKDMVAAGRDLLSPNPYALIENVEELKSWIDQGGLEREVRELKSQ